MSDEPRKRSRFDQAEPEPRRTSRFDQDRRSRSPSNRTPDAGRDRNEVPSRSPAVDPAAKAAEAAARINAQLQARKGIQHVDVPPVRASTSTPTAVQSPDTAATSGGLNKDIYQQDGDYIKDIEVNDLRNRYTLTKGATQKEIKEQTGADVTTRGSYFPDKSMATPTNPPLYLHVTHQTREGLEAALAIIDKMMQVELPNLIDERRFRRREERPEVERDELGRRKWPEERIPIDLEPINGFNLRAQVVGQGGQNVKYIQNETRCKVQIKGRGSGFMEFNTNAESDEPMYLHIAGPDPEQVQRAKGMCEELLGSVKEGYQAFKESGGGRGADRGGYRGGNRGGDHYGAGNDDGYGGGRGGHGGRGGYGRESSGYGDNYNSPAPGSSAMTPTTDPSSAAYGEQAAAYAAGLAGYYGKTLEEFYTQHGGYDAWITYYYPYYLQQAYQQQQGAVPGATDTPTSNVGYSAPAYGAPGYDSPAPPPPSASAPPPPPPPSDSAPPPPPSGPPGAGNYHSVPPPPGM